MATFLGDLSIIQYFLPIFSFVLILIIAYAALMKTKILSENSRINFMVALCAALLAMFASQTLELVEAIVPWALFVLVLLVIVFAIFMFFGLDEETIWSKIGTPGIVWMFFIFLVIFSVGKVFGNYVPNEGPRGAVTNFLFQPQILGVVFILFMAMIIVNNLSGGDLRPKW
ncbi:MAG: hypothetical protein KKH88_04900 [Nanoarchaeota archaeon]|nr:hypothetical protein [Nanoarchaeota archaeon]